ncbi:tRNA lysidine(34) synthetase [Streptobacillus canis]|uniref:tRNA lysidine(34) synthetase n=1 Tax=Streptobacillus canis TaxID=2678686 RepID=UPI0012E2BB32|nr:ATP-binding protein [Streptobacillus canis]
MVNLSCNAIIPDGPLKPVEEIEESIRTTFRKDIYIKFLGAILEYGLIEDGDKIAIAVSGGKDSLLLVKLFQELKKDKRFNFEFKAISLNPGFREEDLEHFKFNLRELNIDCEIIDTNIWKIANEMANDYPCFLCAKMRRGILYKNIEQMGYNKLALGHHFDDVIETTLINLFYGGTLKTMLPKMPSTSGNLTLIRPMVNVHEADIIKFTKKNGIRAMNCGCVIEAGKTSSKRKEIKDMLESLEANNPGLKQKVFKSMENIHLDYVYGYKTKTEKFHIKDQYTKKEGAVEKS